MTARGSDDAWRDLANMVNASSGDFPHLPYHIHDDKEQIARLPPCLLPPFDRGEATRIAFEMYAVAMWVPDHGTAESMEVPDERWRGWQWAPDEFLVVHVYHDPDLPRVGTITFPQPAYSRLDIAGGPMRVWRVAPGDPGWAGTAYAAEVHGYLKPTGNLWSARFARSIGHGRSLARALGGYSISA